MNDEEQSDPCAEKMVFDTEEQAEGSAVAAGWQHGAKLKPYLCKTCGYWHLTSK